MILVDATGRAADPPATSSVTPSALPAKGETGHVAKYSQQPGAKWDPDTGKRLTEFEHLHARQVQEAITLNPLTGKSDYTDTQYHGDVTYQNERAAALNKTIGNRGGGAEADNPRGKALKERVMAGEAIETVDEWDRSLANAQRARDATGSAVTDASLKWTDAGQRSTMFGIQSLQETAAKVREFEQMLKARLAPVAKKVGEAVGKGAGKIAGKALKVVPVAGIGVGLASASAEASQGNYVSAGADAVGVVPVAGDVVDAARLGWAVGEVAGEVLDAVFDFGSGPVGDLYYRTFLK